ncbi:MAG: hypothetical protein KC621_31355 [Myxococcales bacterium]|nr:hypothetical protein [Myxococcales bacterium]
MVFAIVTMLYAPEEPDVVGDSVALSFSVTYYGSGVVAATGRNVDWSTASIMLDPTDSPRQIRDEFVDAVISEGANFGYSLRRRDVVVPALLRGQ